MSTPPPSVPLPARPAPFRVRVSRSRELREARGRPDRFARPTRSASGLAPFRGGLAIVQDDSRLLAWFDPESGWLDYIPLPVPLPAEVLGTARLPKAHKPDLEALCRVPWRLPWGEPGADALVAFGSGSTDRRRWLVVVPETDPTRARALRADGLYDALAARPDLVGCGTNIEGALWEATGPLGGPRLLLAQRGNDAPEAGGPGPVDALIAVPGDVFVAWIEALHGGGPVRFDPACLSGRAVDLGTLRGVRLTLTDICWGPGGDLWYAAVAEDTPDSVQDGPCLGAVVGRIRGDGALEQALLLDADGRPAPFKVEGLTADPVGPGLLAVTDEDGDVAARLLHLAVEPAGPAPGPGLALPAPGA